MEPGSKQFTISIFITQASLVRECQDECRKELTLDNIRKLEAAQAGLAQVSQVLAALNAGRVIEIDEGAIDLRIAAFKLEIAEG